jgi:putative membrane protein
MRLGRIAINALAVLFAGLLVPGISVSWGDGAGRLLVLLLAIALVFGVVNTFVRPIARLLSLPIGFATLGLFGFVIHAGLLLLVAAIIDAAAARMALDGRPLLAIGGFPPDLSPAAVAAAAAGALVISLVSTLLAVLVPDR